MAIYHLNVRVGSRSNGSASLAKHLYIAREGKYAKGTNGSASGQKHSYIAREGKYAGRDELTYLESGNMPAWAQTPKQFWDAVDTYERKDGILHREIEFALPKELNEKQNIELAKRFASYITQDQHPYTLALHKGKGSNPHAHLVFSERIDDGIERAPERWFGKYNTKNPEKGGAKKRTIGAQRQEWLREIREAWARMANEALEHANQEARIDHRSYKDQGVDRVPGVHIGPNVLAMDQKAKTRTNPLMELNRPRRMAKILELDQYRAKLEELKKEKEQLIQAMQDRENEREQEAAKHGETQLPLLRGLEEEYLETPAELGEVAERIEGAYREGTTWRIPAEALRIPKEKLKELGLGGKPTLENLKNVWVGLVKEEAQKHIGQLEEQRKNLRQQHREELEKLEQSKPKKPPKLAFWAQRRYEKEWEAWRRHGNERRKTMNDESGAIEHQIWKIKANPLIKEVKWDAAKQYPILAILGSGAIKALGRKQEEAEKAKRQAEEGKKQEEARRPEEESIYREQEKWRKVQEEQEKREIRKKFALKTIGRLYNTRWESEEKIMHRLIKAAKRGEVEGIYGPDHALKVHPEEYGDTGGRDWNRFSDAELRRNLIGAWLEDELGVPRNKRKYEGLVADVVDKEVKTTKRRTESLELRLGQEQQPHKKLRHRLTLYPRPPKPW